MPQTVMCRRDEHRWSDEYTARGYECLNGCGMAKVTRGAVLLVYSIGRGVLGVRWFCYRQHAASRVAMGNVHPVETREAVFALLEQHERRVHGERPARDQGRLDGELWARAEGGRAEGR